MSDIDRHALIAAEVTLNGKRAVISGARNRFATVRALDGSASAEWTWGTVARIVDNGGAFRT